MAGGKVIDITTYVHSNPNPPATHNHHSQDHPANPFINSKDDFTAALKNEAVLIDFFAEWCGPCKAISPQIEKLSEQYENIKFFKVDVDKLSEVAAENGISAMPTFLFFKNGEKVETVRGANPPAIMAGIQKIGA